MNKLNLKNNVTVTNTLIAICVGVYLITEIAGDTKSSVDMVRYGAKFNPLIISGDWWRFITPIFLHFGLMHLIMNMFSLYVLGPAVETLFGKLRFFIIFMLSGMIGVMASFAFIDGVSAGASGAIFGLLGALLYYAWLEKEADYKVDVKQIMVIVAINLVYGFSVSSIDNAGHLGGFLGGFLTAMIVSLPTKKLAIKNFVGGLVTIGLIYLLLHIGYQQKYLFSSMNNQDGPGIETIVCASENPYTYIQ